MQFWKPRSSALAGSWLVFTCQCWYEFSMNPHAPDGVNMFAGGEGAIDRSRIGESMECLHDVRLIPRPILEAALMRAAKEIAALHKSG